MAKRPTHSVQLRVEQLEDRTVPHGGITEFSGITPNAAPTGIVLGPDSNFWFTEFGANAIGRITPTGTVPGFAVPGAGSGPV